MKSQKEVEKMQQEVIIDFSTFYTSRAKFSELSSYRQKVIDLVAVAGSDKEVVLTGAAPVWLYLDIAHALHGKVKSLIYRSPVTGDVVVGDYAPEGTLYIRLEEGQGLLAPPCSINKGGEIK